MWLVREALELMAGLYFDIGEGGMSALVLEPLASYCEYPRDEMQERSARFLEEMRRRRTVHDFPSRRIDREVIENCLKAAGTAPSGANLQPWHFTVITDPAMRRRIGEAAEIEGKEFHEGRAPAEWLAALAPLGTDANKPLLETTPVLIAVFARRHDQLPDGRKVKRYCVPESVGIAVGFLITGLHHCGLATLTHTAKALDRENAFELFMRIMNDPQCGAASCPSRAPSTSFSRESRPELRGTSCANCDGVDCRYSD